MFVSVINNVDLKNNTKKLQKIILSAQIGAINLSQVDLDKPWYNQWYWYEKAPPSPLRPFERSEGQLPRHTSSGVPVHIYTHSLYSLL